MLAKYSPLRKLDPKALTKRVRARARILNLMVRDGLPVTDNAVEQQISCPFHGQDNSPSMRIYPSTNSCHCFTCQKSWDPISYEMRKRGMQFWEAVESLVDRFSIDVSTVPGRTFDRRPHDGLPDIKQEGMTHELLVKSFHKALLGSRSLFALEAYSKLVFILTRLKVEKNPAMIKELAGKLVLGLRKNRNS